MFTTEEFLNLARDRSLFPEKVNRVVVACSGGADSLFLLYLLWSVRGELGLELSVLTCDHGLRPESAKEAHDVRQRAWTLGLPCQLHELDVPGNQQGDESVEMTARRLRRKAYVQTAREFGAHKVALGHHQDDQAETVLLKLARGTGPRGAGGMDWISPLEEEVLLVRPLLSTSRRDIEKQVAAWGLHPAVDASNQDREYLRNRVRHEIMPLLCGRINPKAVEHLAQFAEQQRKLEAWVSAMARERGKGCVKDGCLHLEPWRFLPEILQERLFMGWLREIGGDPGLAGSGQFQEVLQDLNRQAPHARRWEIGGIPLRCDQDVLSREQTMAVPGQKTLPCPGNVIWEPLHRPLKLSPARNMDLKACRNNDFSQPLTAYMRMPPPGKSLSLRSPRPGDQYRPLGMKGRAKLSDLFINRHLPARVRPVWPVVVCGGEIVWVPGFRVADQWRVEKGDCLKLEFS